MAEDDRLVVIPSKTLAHGPVATHPQETHPETSCFGMYEPLITFSFMLIFV